MTLDPVGVAVEIGRIFDDLAINYLVGGSVASSVHGIYRLTNDVDIVAEIGNEHVGPLGAKLTNAFDIDEDMIREAISRRASFNVIHRESGFKADIFVPRYDIWTRRTLRRGVRIPVADGSLAFCSAEDIILQKLIWFRLGGEVSIQQWKDVLGVLRVQAGNLDEAYLDEWAPLLEVGKLLSKARAEAKE
jgi:hypothetical protein